MKDLLSCTKCNGTLPLEVYNAEDLVECPTCKSKTGALVFPAFLNRLEAVSAEPVLDEAESSCFFHPNKKAAVACESCGRFICSLCEIEIGGVRLCPQCLDSGKRKGKLTNLEGSRTLYDNIALLLSLGFLPIFTIGLTCMSAPAAFYLCLRYRKAPRSLVRPGRWKWWTALILSSLQIIGWIVFLIYLFNSPRHTSYSPKPRPSVVHSSNSSPNR